MDKVTCKCGKKLAKHFNITRHEKSTMHKRYVENTRLTAEREKCLKLLSVYLNDLKK